MSDTPEKLIEYREKIDACDQKLLETLAERYGIVREVGLLKVDANMEAVQPVRAQAVKDNAVRKGAEMGLNPAFVQQLYDLIIDHAHDLEHEILDKEDKGT